MRKSEKMWVRCCLAASMGAGRPHLLPVICESSRENYRNTAHRIRDNRIACCHFSLPFYDQIIAQHGQVEDIVRNNQRLFQEMNRLVIRGTEGWKGQQSLSIS